MVAVDALIIDVVDATGDLLVDETADDEAIEHLAELLPELAAVAALPSPWT